MTTESILIYTTETPRKRSGCNDPRCCDQNFYEYASKEWNEGVMN